VKLARRTSGRREGTGGDPDHLGARLPERRQMANALTTYADNRDTHLSSLRL
jgi:hypothetical protein